MSDTDSTASTPPGKPAKSYPDFSLFAHAGGVWAKGGVLAAPGLLPPTVQQLN